MIEMYKSGMIMSHKYNARENELVVVQGMILCYVRNLLL